MSSPRPELPQPPANMKKTNSVIKEFAAGKYCNQLIAYGNELLKQETIKEEELRAFQVAYDVARTSSKNEELKEDLKIVLDKINYQTKQKLIQQQPKVEKKKEFVRRTNMRQKQPEVADKPTSAAVNTVTSAATINSPVQELNVEENAAPEKVRPSLIKTTRRLDAGREKVQDLKLTQLAQLSEEQQNKIKLIVTEIYTTEDIFRNKMSTLVDSVENNNVKLNKKDKNKLAKFLSPYKQLADQRPIISSQSVPSDLNVASTEMNNYFENFSTNGKPFNLATAQYPKFMAFLSELQNTKPDWYEDTLIKLQKKNFPRFDAVLVEPSQRIARYKILLEDLEKNLPEKSVFSLQTNLALSHVEASNDQLMLFLKQVDIEPFTNLVTNLDEKLNKFANTFKEPTKNSINQVKESINNISYSGNTMDASGALQDIVIEFSKNHNNSGALGSSAEFKKSLKEVKEIINKSEFCQENKLTYEKVEEDMNRMKAQCNNAILDVVQELEGENGRLGTKESIQNAKNTLDSISFDGNIKNVAKVLEKIASALMQIEPHSNKKDLENFISQTGSKIERSDFCCENKKSYYSAKEAVEKSKSAEKEKKPIQVEPPKDQEKSDSSNSLKI